MDFQVHGILGHTKFESDVAAQKTAGSFNRSDCFNHGMLVKLFSPYVNAKAYDGELLKLYKETTANLFKPINNITKYRQFTFLGDDGTGEVDKDLQKTAGEEGWPDGGDFYTDESLTTAAENAAERSLKVLLPIVCGDGAPGVQYRGVGDETGYFGPVGESYLFPNRRVRLFMRRSHQDAKWREQPGYHIWGDSETHIDELLKHVVSFENAPEEVRGRDTPYWGQKKQHLIEHYKKFVPPEHVPDHFELGDAGQSGHLTDRTTLDNFSLPAADQPPTTNHPSDTAPTTGDEVPASGAAPTTDPTNPPASGAAPTTKPASPAPVPPSSPPIFSSKYPPYSLRSTRHYAIIFKPIYLENRVRE